MKITILCLAAAAIGCTLQSTRAGAATWRVPDDAATIQAGIDSSSAGDTVLVRSGTYYEHDIRLKSYVCLRSETGEAGCVTIDAQQQDRVFYLRFTSGMARIEGFTITGGLASEGGGLYFLDNASVTLENCTITANSAYGNGGGVACQYNSSPVFVNCTITDNVGEGGGGIHCEANCNPIFNGCSINGNTASAGSGGGASCFFYCSPVFNGCAFSGNTAYTGGAIRCFMGCAITLDECTFSTNRADWWAGAADLNDCTAAITDCTFSANSSGRGGAMVVYGASATLFECSFTGNSAGSGGGLFLESVSYVFADSTVFDGNTATSSGAHAYVEIGSELVLRCSVSDLTGFEGDGAITMDNEGCGTATENTSWSRLKIQFGKTSTRY